MKISKIPLPNALHALAIILIIGIVPFKAMAQHRSTINGDVNGDYEVNIADLNVLINIIIEGTFSQEADVNKDGEISIADVNTIIELILGGGAVQPVSQLVVWHKDSTKLLFNLNEHPKITHLEGKVIISGATTVEYDFGTVKKLTYRLGSANHLQSLPICNERQFFFDGETLTFLPADQDLHISITLLDGKVIQEFTAKKNEPQTISLHLSMAETYLVNVNGVTYKISTK